LPEKSHQLSVSCAMKHIRYEECLQIIDHNYSKFESAKEMAHGGMSMCALLRKHMIVGHAECSDVP
jgi:hypothetical protein